MKSTRSGQVASLLVTAESPLAAVTFSMAASLCFMVMLEWIQAAFRLAGRPDS